MINTFLTDTLAIAAGSDVQVRFVPTSKVYMDGVRVSGYFEEGPGGNLICAIKKPFNEWFPIFVHESCHMDQWIENSLAWCGTTGPNDEDYTESFWDWLDGKDVPKASLDKSIRALQYLEEDCERRTVKKIKKYDLPIDIDDYIRHANLYIFSYQYMKETRKWSSTIIEGEAWHAASKKFYPDYNFVPGPLLRAMREDTKNPKA